jgi:voltage-gated potassium channel
MPIFLIAAKLLSNVKRNRIVSLLTLAAVCLVGGGIAFAAVEHRSVGTGLYWAVTTATTVGYGDVVPTNSAGRVVAVFVMLTTIPIFGAVFALFAGVTVLSHLRRLLGMDNQLPEADYTVAYGDHPVLLRVVTELIGADDPVVLVAPTKPVGLPAHVTHIAGDPTEDATVSASHPERASRALIACNDDTDALVIAVALRAIVPALVIYALVSSPRIGRAMREVGVTHTLSSDELVGHTLAKALETPEAGDLLLQMVDSTSYAMRDRVVEGSLVDKRLSQARATVGALVLGVARDGRIDIGIDDDPLLAAGDRLIELVSIRSAPAP